MTTGVNSELINLNSDVTKPETRIKLNEMVLQF